ncbi:hypothetical protein [Novosphingopyxis baekryungensis]|uniref:hypothetical protein n=1 Tax=Novosphingopyxis baekryungensis TaxID=279369 RepID=UPI0003B5A657|nr:hypothetical protein [Novosphingopyxis baekryungensis]
MTSPDRAGRPLIITDCDEVLLHMVVPFAEWLDEAHGIHFDLDHGGFAEALRHKHDGTVVEQEEVWPLLNAFFDDQMNRQQPIDGAVEAIRTLAAKADVVVLTNLLDHRQEARTAQLKAVGIDHEVRCNQGGKGTPLSEIVDRFDPSVTVFIDDLPNHHESVKKHRPEVWRLHMVGEPRLAGSIPPAPDAHARIDRWDAALEWIEARLAEGHAPVGETV